MSVGRPAGDAAQARLRREIDHDHRLGARAEVIWNWSSPAGQRRAARRAAFFVRHAALVPGRRALELGCGTGVFLEQTLLSGAIIFGLDLSATLLEQARARVGACAAARLVRGDAHRTPFGAASFDAVYGSSVLHHLDLDTALHEAARVLKPGGRLVFTEPNLLNPQIAFTFLLAPRARFGLSPDEMAFTRGRARRALERAGFTALDVRAFDFLHPSLPAALLPAAERALQRLEAVPLVRAIAGSLLIRATRA